MIEREIVFDRNNYKSYKDFYKDICKKMDAKNDLNCLYPEDLALNGNVLNEFLWDYSLDNIKFIFVGFDKEKIKLEKNFDDYQYAIILRTFERFVNKYPNNELEFKDK